MSVYVSDTVSSGDVPLSTHTPHTCHFPYPKAPLASFLLPSIQIIITVITPYAALSVITELL